MQRETPPDDPTAEDRNKPRKDGHYTLPGLGPYEATDSFESSPRYQSDTYIENGPST